MELKEEQEQLEGSLLPGAASLTVIHKDSDFLLANVTNGTYMQKFF